MSDEMKVVGLDGKPRQFDAAKETDPEIIQTCREILAAAERGDIVSFGYVYQDRVEYWQNGWWAENRMTLIGALDYLKTRVHVAILDHMAKLKGE